MTELERKKTHLIYLDKDGYAWMQEHHLGKEHPKNAEFYCEVPSNDNLAWIQGKPCVSNEQFLTLSPFYPSQRLDVSIEIDRTPKIMQYENHPAFSGCVKFMPINTLDFRPIPIYIARSIFTIGLCHYGHTEAFKTVEVEEDNKLKAIEKGKVLLNPSTVESVKYIDSRPNEEYNAYYAKTPPFPNSHNPPTKKMKM